MADIKEKIKKLLSLATSSNEHEAKDALLKARALMAKHKLSETEFAEKPELRQHICKNISWTTDSGYVWMVELAKTIADNHCCVASWSTPVRSHTHTLIVSGISDDLEICVTIIEYTFEYVMNKIKKFDKASSKISYAKGFILGLQFAYEDQNEDNPEWALVVSKPKEVSDYENNLKHRTVKTKKPDEDTLAFVKGQNDGLRFNQKKTLAGA